MRLLKHPNIMEFYDFSGDRNAPEGIFMFLELCEGGTLGNLIANKMTELRAYTLFKQLVDAMAYMNDQRTRSPMQDSTTATSSLTTYSWPHPAS
jgi:serine/threonine protein kinase